MFNMLAFESWCDGPVTEKNSCMVLTLKTI